jgi:DNA repair ATPase RecN
MQRAFIAAVAGVVLATTTASAAPVQTSVKLASVEDKIHAMTQRITHIADAHNSYVPMANLVIDDYQLCVHFVRIGALRDDCSFDAAQAQEAEARLDGMKAAHRELSHQLEALRRERNVLRLMLDGREGREPIIR